MDSNVTPSLYHIDIFNINGHIFFYKFISYVQHNPSAYFKPLINNKIFSTLSNLYLLILLKFSFFYK